MPKDIGCAGQPWVCYARRQQVLVVDRSGGGARLRGLIQLPRLLGGANAAETD